MKLSFDKIKYKNLLSVGSKPIEIDFSSNKRTLITGTNGSGKSTLLEAISFGVFGKPFRKIKKDQLINSVNKKQCVVEVWLSSGKNKFYIKRGIKPGVLTFEKNGEEVVEDASSKDYQQVIEKMIGLNFNTFKQIIVLGTAGFTPFMELPTGKKREFGEDIINVSIFGRMSELNKKASTSIKNNMEKLDLQITGLRNEIEAHREHIENYKKQSEQHQKQFQRMYDEYVTEAKRLKQEITELKSKLEQYESEFDDSYESKYDSLNREISKYEFKLNDIDSQMEFFNNHDNCPTCHQDLTSDIKKTSVDELNESRKKVDEGHSKVKSEIKSVKRLLDEHRELMNCIRTTRSDIKSKTSDLEVIVGKAKRIKSQLNDKPKLDLDKIKSLKSDLTKLKQEKADLFEEKYARSLVSKLLKDDGIKSQVVNQYIPLINKEINRYLKMMGADYTLNLDSTFNEEIKTIGKENFSYASFSQGEKARIDISMIFAWREIAQLVSGIQINLLIMDEVFDSATDDDGIKGIQRILNDIESNVVIISHRESHDKDKFDNHVKMVKKGRFTYAIS